MPPHVANRLTQGDANDQLLYFTSPSLTADDRTLVFLSDRGSTFDHAGDPRSTVNLWAQDRETGATERLSDNADGILRSYVYFDGLAERGLGLASACLHAASGDVYYLQGRTLYVVNAHTSLRRALNQVPPGVVTGFSHVSDDNQLLCVPTIDAQAFRDRRAIDATVQHLGLSSHLRCYRTSDGVELSGVSVERGWVTHVQFRPGYPEHLLFNHEWPAECGIRRIWLWDGQAIRRMRDAGDDVGAGPRRATDWICHEVWARDGAWIIYHGTSGGHNVGHSLLGRVRPDGSQRREIPFPGHFRRYGHFSLGITDDTLVSDGYFEPDSAAAPAGGDPALGARGGGAYISTLQVDWAAATINWQPRCVHGSSWGSQDAHPHPVFSHRGDHVLFTSDVTGRRAVYTVSAD